MTVDGQLKSIGGTVDVATPAGRQISKIYFKDGETVSKGQLLLTFDTRQASEQKSTLESLILLEKKELQIDYLLLIAKNKHFKAVEKFLSRD